MELQFGHLCSAHSVIAFVCVSNTTTRCIFLCRWCWADCVRLSRSPRSRPCGHRGHYPRLCRTLLRIEEFVCVFFLLIWFDVCVYIDRCTSVLIFALVGFQTKKRLYSIYLVNASRLRLEKRGHPSAKCSRGASTPRCICPASQPYTYTIGYTLVVRSSVWRLTTTIRYTDLVENDEAGHTRKIVYWLTPTQI